MMKTVTSKINLAASRQKSILRICIFLIHVNFGNRDWLKLSFKHTVIYLIKLLYLRLYFLYCKQREIFTYFKEYRHNSSLY